MKISQVNYNTPTFNGKILTKGKWPVELKQAFEENQGLFSEFADQGYDVVARLSKSRASKNSFNFTKGDLLYKIKLSFLKENSIISKILDFLHLLPRLGFTKHFHSLFGNRRCLDTEHLDRFRDKFETYYKLFG